MITGSLVAIVTPMHDDGSLDFPRLRSLIDWHIAEGTDGIVIVGTTGESPTVTVGEHCELIRVAVEHCAGRVPVIAGTGANSTAEAVELPLILYNVPGRTVADLANDTVLRLAEVSNIVGLKDATGNLDRACDLIERAPADFALYSGDDMTSAAFLMLGGHGVISVTANVAPRAMHALCATAAAGDMRTLRETNAALTGLHRDLFCEANPIPVKWAVARMGLVGDGIRLPLTPLSAAHHERVRAAMRKAGIQA